MVNPHESPLIPTHHHEIFKDPIPRWCPTAGDRFTVDCRIEEEDDPAYPLPLSETVHGVAMGCGELKAILGLKSGC